MLRGSDERRGRSSEGKEERGTVRFESISACGHLISSVCVPTSYRSESVGSVGSERRDQS